MNFSELQAELRHFAAERDWQPFHTPKNLSTALMIEAAELAEIFQWMTPGESADAHRDPATKTRIGEELADVLLYLLQLADRSQVDLERAVADKLARNAVKYPARRTIARAAPASPARRGTHVLLDYENVQPTEDDLRGMVPDASDVWIFHGPHQRDVARRFASFGGDATVVPISRTGKDALDFHLSFYLGYLAARNKEADIVVVANDKGYAPMLEHARAMGFAVRQQGHGAAGPRTPAKKAPPAAKKAAAVKAAARSKPAAKQPAARPAPAKKAAPARHTTGSALPLLLAAAPHPGPPLPAGSLRKITESLRNMGDKRPTRAASLRRALKSLLGVETADALIEVALDTLVAQEVVVLDAGSHVAYPGFAA